MKTTCYLQVEPEFVSWIKDRPGSISVRRVTQKKPTSPLPGCLLVRLNLDIADIAFMPLQPVAEVIIPAHLTAAVEAEAAPVEVAV